MNIRKYYTKNAIHIKTINLELEKLANAKLKPFALTFSQFKTLRLLAIESPEAVRQVDIERAFSMTNPTVTSLLHGLENGGWIERVENPDDNRSKFVRLTKKAERIAADLESLGNEIEAELTGALSDEEKSTLHALLLKMVPQEN